MIRRLWAASIWAKGAIPPDEWKFRNLKRVWLPIYDVIAVFCGIQAVLSGSPLLNTLFPDTMIDALGYTMSTVAIVCFAGVSFPRLWVVEIIGKIILVGLISAYVATILLLSQNAGSNLFVVGMLTFGLPLAFFRLNLLGEELKERRAVTA
ncbi:hypothetical protein [Microbacterium sp.]|uniref:hypothetical protein n=1 Tax=Microbacterium sp. TaxID=51671 RepID=UPI003242F800